MPTRSQQNFIRAQELVASVTGEETRKIYGGLCHSFPVMVRSCGLCQALAFSLDKASKDGPRAKAHKLIIEHVGQIIGAGSEQKAIVSAVSRAGTREYMLHTRQVLDAWIYFKRFAVSILGVDAADQKDDRS